MQRMSLRQYGQYSKEARKRGEDIYDRRSAQALFRSAFYEADRKAQRENVGKVIGACIAAAVIMAVIVIVATAVL